MTVSKPSLLLVVSEDWYFLSHRLALAQAAMESGLRVVVATGPGERAHEIAALGVEHRTLALSRLGFNPLRELRAVSDLRRLMLELEPSIVHLVAAKPIVYGNVAASLAGGPPVLNAVAGLGYMYLGDGLKRRALRTAYEQTFRRFVRPRARARVLVQNADDAELLVRRRLVHPAQLACIVGSGVDIERFRVTPEPASGPLVILCHTRMLWDKGVGELVAAAEYLKARGVGDLVVRLVGAPDRANPRAISERELARWARAGVVEWLGRRDDIPAQLARCHIACLPSYREGAPLSLLEAAAAGRPIVTSDVPGCREVVRHGVNGLLVPPRDSLSLAAALEQLLRDPEKRARMGSEGRLRAEREFAAGVVNARIVATYQSMLRGRLSA
jgi:glycosyltransferase involved in cell wall biosynthesis